MPEVSDITIEEYSSNEKQPILLSDADLNYLESDCFHRGRTPSFEICKETRGEKHFLRNSSYAGIIQLPDKRRIVFSTKVRTNLFYLLSFLKDESRFYFDSDVVIDIKEGENFFDILGRFFLNDFNNILQSGLLKKYVKKHEDVRYLKGRLDIRGQIIHNIYGRPIFSAIYDDLTFDNQENRIVLRALHELTSLIRFNDDLRHELSSKEQLLIDFVSLVPISPRECDEITFNRLNDKYQDIIHFSKIIIEEKYIRSTEKGEAKGFNFIVDMNKVFQDFVTEIIKEVVNEDGDFSRYDIVDQKPFKSLDLEGQLTVIPDIIIEEKGQNNRYPVILDTKYKKHDKNTDYYQIISYALAIPTAKSCCLLYPKDFIKEEELFICRNVLEKNRDISIYVRGIDLYVDDDLDFKGYIKKMKSQVKGILSTLLS
ncbi:hypothetical protein KAR91_60805 [Candidatus Pacearchaeota archaeon]|nr:hypothetical protein [Candidatus Pacearchaeota archaeon]